MQAHKCKMLFSHLRRTSKRSSGYRCKEVKILKDLLKGDDDDDDDDDDADYDMM